MVKPQVVQPFICLEGRRLRCLLGPGFGDLSQVRRGWCVEMWEFPKTPGGCWEPQGEKRDYLFGIMQGLF